MCHWRCGVSRETLGQSLPGIRLFRCDLPGRLRQSHSSWNKKDYLGGEKGIWWHRLFGLLIYSSYNPSALKHWKKRGGSCQRARHGTRRRQDFSRKEAEMEEDERVREELKGLVRHLTRPGGVSFEQKTHVGRLDSSGG